MGGSVGADVGAGAADGFGVPLDEVCPEARFLSGEAKERPCSCVMVTTGETAMMVVLGRAAMAESAKDQGG